MKDRVLVIATHPDDELLGCGATIALHASKGDEVHVIIVCEGESMRNQDSTLKNNAMICAAYILGTNLPLCLGLPDQHLDTVPIVDIVAPIEREVMQYKPTIVYCQSGSDLNKDHQIVFEAAMVALRPKQLFIREIYTFYTVGSSEWNFPMTFIPDTWIGFSEDVMKQKLKAFNCYDSEKCEYPHPRSEQGLINLARATGNQCCMEYAESFKTIRKIIRAKDNDLQ